MLAIGTIAAAAGAGAAWWSRRGANAYDATAAAPLWSQRFERPQGGELVMAQLRGHPLVVNFWATWCPPCVKELPALDRFHRGAADHGWQVVAVAIDSGPAVREFLERVPVTMPVGLGGPTGTELLRALGNVQGGLPFTVMIAADGRVAWRKLGETSIDELQREARRA